MNYYQAFSLSKAVLEVKKQIIDIYQKMGALEKNNAKKSPEYANLKTVLSFLLNKEKKLFIEGNIDISVLEMESLETDFFLPDSPNFFAERSKEYLVSWRFLNHYDAGLYHLFNVYLEQNLQTRQCVEKLWIETNRSLDQLKDQPLIKNTLIDFKYALVSISYHLQTKLSHKTRFFDGYFTTDNGIEFLIDHCDYLYSLIMMQDDEIVDGEGMINLLYLKTLLSLLPECEINNYQDQLGFLFKTMSYFPEKAKTYDLANQVLGSYLKK